MFRLVHTATAILVAVVGGLAAPGVRAATESEAGARAAIAETVDEVFAVLRDKSTPTEDRIRSIEQIVYGRFDLYVMSRLVLARNWKRFSEEQKAQYIEEFKRYLTNSYGNRIERHDQQEVEIVGAREEPRGDVVVHTKILDGEFEGALVDYRLRRQNLDWLVIDVVIEGISMVSNYRDQFKSIVSSGGPELLLEKLKEKNAAGMVIDAAAKDHDLEVNRDDARAIIEDFIDALLTIRYSNLSANERELALVETVGGLFDLYLMSSLVLARNWERFSEDQKAEYVEEFAVYFTITYVRRMERYGLGPVELLNAFNDTHGDVVVRTRVTGTQVGNLR